MLPVRALESSDGGESTFPDRDKNVLPPLRQNKIAMTPDKANFVLHNLCSLHGDIRKSQQSENIFRPMACKEQMSTEDKVSIGVDRLQTENSG